MLAIEELQKTPFLVLGNKIDAPGAVSEEELRYQLGLMHTTGKGSVKLPDNVRPIELYMCSVVCRQGYGPGTPPLSPLLIYPVCRLPLALSVYKVGKGEEQRAVAKSTELK